MDSKLVQDAIDARTDLVQRRKALMGCATKFQEPFCIRGHLDNLESVLNDAVTELEYHLK